MAEVASNFNQAMVRDWLFRTQDDPQFQIAVIEEAMDNIHRYFFIMPTLARFELEAHQRAEKGQSLTADDLNALMADLFSEGYGSEMQVDRDRVGITWAEFGHLYANFYVFQYATGISAAHALSRRILDGVPNAVEHYLGMLQAGGSKYPVDALRDAGVDMTGPEAVETTFGIHRALLPRTRRCSRNWPHAPRRCDCWRADSRCRPTGRLARRQTPRAPASASRPARLRGKCRAGSDRSRRRGKSAPGWPGVRVIIRGRRWPDGERGGR